MSEIARLMPVDLRELWRREDSDFTCWLAENLDYLEEATGLRLQLVEREASAGSFSADILAEEAGGETVIIENQLERTNHDHLGKLLTYMVNLGAKIAIWIASHPRPEHEKVVQWMNEILPADSGIYLLQLEAFRIGNSPPAPKFTVIAGPSEEGRAFGAERKQLAERHRLRLEFWNSLLENLQRKGIRLHANISPSKESWISTGAGKTGLGYAYVILKNAGRVELYIDAGEHETNKAYFDRLHAHKEEIEATFGAPLRWERLDNRRASRIAFDVTGHGGLRDRDRWPELQDAMIDAMVRLERAFREHVRRL